MDRKELREMIIEVMEAQKITFNAGIRDRFYNLADAGHGLESLGKETKDAVIKLYAKKILALKDSLEKHLNAQYPKWD